MRHSRLFQHFEQALAQPATTWGLLRWRRWGALALTVAMAAGPVSAQTGAPASGAEGGAGPRAPVAAKAAASETASVPAVQRRWAQAPRVFGRLGAKDIGLLINTDDPYSVQVGEHYIQARGLSENQVLRVRLPNKGTLSASEFAELSAKVDAFYGQRVQGLALAWRQPFAVECNAITGALTLGFDPKLCSNTCAVSRPSSYFGSISTRPYKDHHMRLSMLLAARDADAAKALIDRGVRADGTLGLRGGMPAHAHFVTTSDPVRSVRQLLFPPAGLVKAFNVDVHLDQTDALRDVDRVLLYMTGRVAVDGLETVRFLPGALADHLTSFGGVLDRATGQMTVLSWIDAGATASYGTTSEPCAHLQKFPNPQALLIFYMQGATALEAYWKSVAWPQQGLFIGEPLSAPFARP